MAAKLLLFTVHTQTKKLNIPLFIGMCRNFQFGFVCIVHQSALHQTGLLG